MVPSSAGDTNSDTVPSRGTVVYELASGCTLEEVEEDKYYRATVNGVVEYGAFVDLSEKVSGLVHNSNLIGEYDVGDELIVELLQVREDGDLSFGEVQVGEHETARVEHGERVGAGALANRIGDTVHLEGQVVQINQTPGPTIFQVRDETGIVPCAAFEEAGVRAHPAVEMDDYVRISGSVEKHENAIQVEVDTLAVLEGEKEASVQDRLAAALEEQSEPADIDPLIEWDTMDQLWDSLEEVARLLRKSVLEGRPIRMRHHADGDGMCASVPVQLALENFIEQVHEDPSSPRHLFKRLPSKAPFYEMEDVTRDLNFSLEDRERHGQKLPLLFMVDNGSTEEDTPAYRAVREYDIPVAVVDHHHPDPEAVEPLLEAHVNPYLVGEDYSVTTGMMCVELARMIDPDISDQLHHVPAVAGLSDRSDADAMEDYLDLAREEGYDKEELRDIGEALDYAAFWLRYNAGRNLINDTLNVGCDARERHEELVDLLSSRAEQDVNKQLGDALPHVESEELDNGAQLFRVDVENYAHRFTYPAPGKTTGEIHDRKVKETGGPVITIGYGPDFSVLRSDGVRLDIPQMVTELTEEVEGAGVSGGGHLVVGSIKFVKGMREEVLDALVEKMADAELDEDLSSTIVD